MSPASPPYKTRFREYLSTQGLKSTRQRNTILDEFVKCGGHQSAEDIYLRLRKKHPTIGYATVYRTLKLFAECGIAVERHFGDKQTRYEILEKGEHHDHLICNGCGTIVEFECPRIEQLQDEVALENGFQITDHRLELYGLCEKCARKER